MSSRDVPTQTLSSRFLGYFVIAYLLTVSLLGLAVDRSTRSTVIERSDAAIEVAATVARASLPEDESRYEQWAAEIFRLSGFRTTLVRSDGVVLADSHLDVEGMENHVARPEIRAALDGRVGTHQRRSASTGFEQHYVALPPVDGLIIRMSVPTRVLSAELGDSRATIGLIAVVIGLIGVLVMTFLARRLARPIGELTDQARAVADGDLAIAPRRSSVRELDELGTAISTIAARLGGRLAEAKAATETMEAVLGGVSNGTILVDGDDHIAYANPAAEAILGPIPADLAHLAPLQIPASVREVRESGREDSRTLEHGSAPARKLRLLSRPLDEDRVLVLLIDITAQERTDSVRRDFVANASHELKTPVSTIIASADALMIALDRDDESPERFAARITESAQQLDRLVSDLLDLSRLERDSPGLSPTRLDLLVRSQVEALRDETEARQLEVDVQVEEISAMANERDISIAVRNLLQNAARYSEPGGEIRVSLTSGDDQAEITISDTGEGIPIRDLERVFERFYRVDSARSRETGGTGLGLAIAKHVAESHGGSISVESELGVGSTFTIVLPLAPSGEAPRDN